MTNMFIETKNISVKTLNGIIDNEEISKPGWQRKAKWEDFPKNNKKIPNKKDYITFLNETEHSGDLIHIAVLPNNRGAHNLDGNNRITAIREYINKPFYLFPEYLDAIDNWIDNCVFEIKKDDKENNEDKLKKTLTHFFKNLTYNECKYFDYKKQLEEKQLSLYKKYFKVYRDDFENHGLDKLIIKKIKTNNDNFLDDVLKIAVNYYNNYSEEQSNKIYLSLNQYKNGGFTHHELAEAEFNQTFINISNKDIEYNIKTNTKKYYELKNEKEVLKCYEYTEGKLNAFQFLVGFQIYCNSKYDFIPNYILNNNNNTQLFFKLYENEYIDKFDDNNIDEFIKNIIYCCDILKNVFYRIMPDTGIFKKLNTNMKLNDNNYVLLINLIVYLKKDETIDDNTIKKEIEKIILYNKFCKEEEKLEMENNFLKYVTGGNYIPDKVKKIKKNPKDFIKKITVNDFKNILNNISKEYNPKLRYKENSDVFANNKRKVRRFSDLILLNYYCQNNLSYSLIEQEFEFEHLIPFSSRWDDTVDIENLGNIIPILKNLNRKRGKNHINKYLDVKNLDKEGKQLINNFSNIFDIVKKNYDNIIVEINKNPSIKNNKIYETQCSEIRNIYIDTLISKLYN